jgi:hypothetical protein
LIWWAKRVSESEKGKKRTKVEMHKEVVTVSTSFVALNKIVKGDKVI